MYFSKLLKCGVATTASQNASLELTQLQTSATGSLAVKRQGSTEEHAQHTQYTTTASSTNTHAHLPRTTLRRTTRGSEQPEQTEWPLIKTNCTQVLFLWDVDGVGDVRLSIAKAHGDTALTSPSSSKQ